MGMCACSEVVLPGARPGREGGALGVAWWTDAETGKSLGEVCAMRYQLVERVKFRFIVCYQSQVVMSLASVKLQGVVEIRGRSVNS